MTYKLFFTEQGLKEWKKLDNSVASLFKKKLIDVLENPHIPKNRLSGYTGYRYKIKLKSIGFRLLYEVIDDQVIVKVISVNRRDSIYKR